jgi:hypothetical protein
MPNLQWVQPTLSSSHELDDQGADKNARQQASTVNQHRRQCDTRRRKQWRGVTRRHGSLQSQITRQRVQRRQQKNAPQACNHETQNTVINWSRL